MAEYGGGEPLFAVVGNGSGGHLVEPEELGIERGAGIMRKQWRSGGQSVKEIAVDDVNQVEFAASEAQHLNIAIGLRPAREISGDVYGFFEQAEDSAVIAFGDVSGKGAAAALYGALIMGLLRTDVRAGSSQSYSRSTNAVRQCRPLTELTKGANFAHSPAQYVSRLA